MNKGKTIKEFEKKLNELIAYAVGGKCGERDVNDCKQELESWFSSKLTEQKKELLEKIEKAKHKLPKKPNTLKNGWSRLEKDKKWINQCLKYSSRFNYNQALEDIKKLLT